MKIDITMATGVGLFDTSKNGQEAKTPSWRCNHERLKAIAFSFFDKQTSFKSVDPETANFNQLSTPVACVAVGQHLILNKREALAGFDWSYRNPRENLAFREDWSVGLPYRGIFRVCKVRLTPLLSPVSSVSLEILWEINHNEFPKDCRQSESGSQIWNKLFCGFSLKGERLECFGCVIPVAHLDISFQTSFQADTAGAGVNFFRRETVAFEPASERTA